MISDVLFLATRLGVCLALFTFLSQTWDATRSSWSACAAETSLSAEASGNPADIAQSLQQLTHLLPFIPVTLRQADDGQPVSASCSRG